MATLSSSWSTNISWFCIPEKLYFITLLLICCLLKYKQNGNPEQQLTLGSTDISCICIPETFISFLLSCSFLKCKQMATLSSSWPEGQLICSWFYIVKTLFHNIFLFICSFLICKQISNPEQHLNFRWKKRNNFFRSANRR